MCSTPDNCFFIILTYFSWREEDDIFWMLGSHTLMLTILWQIATGGQHRSPGPYGMLPFPWKGRPKWQCLFLGKKKDSMISKKAVLSRTESQREITLADIPKISPQRQFTHVDRVRYSFLPWCPPQSKFPSWYHLGHLLNLTAESLRKKSSTH